MALFSANVMRAGWVIAHNNKRYTVTGITKVKPGKGGAFVQAELRDVDTGAKGNDRWRSEDKVEKLMVEDIQCQFLYSDGTDSYFMNLTNFDQFTLTDDALGDQLKFLEPEMNVRVSFIDNAPLSITLPKTVIAVVAETEPSLRGQTVSSSGGKPAVLENGVRVQVPVFIEQGERLVINTETMEYVERAK